MLKKWRQDYQLFLVKMNKCNGFKEVHIMLVVEQKLWCSILMITQMKLYLLEVSVEDYLKTQIFQIPIIHGNLSLKIFHKISQSRQLLMTLIILKYFMLEQVNHTLQVMHWEMVFGSLKMEVIAGLKFLVEILKIQQHL